MVSSLRSEYVYTVIERPAEGLARIYCMQYGTQLWTKGCVRKSEKKCATCGRAIAPGSSAYLPLANGMNRGHRLCEKCVEGCKIEAPRAQKRSP